MLPYPKIYKCVPYWQPHKDWGTGCVNSRGDIGASLCSMTAAVVWMSPLKVKLQQNYIQNRLPDVVIQIAVVSLFITIFSRGGGGRMVLPLLKKRQRLAHAKAGGRRFHLHPLMKRNWRPFQEQLVRHTPIVWLAHLPLNDWGQHMGTEGTWKHLRGSSMKHNQRLPKVLEADLKIIES